MKNKIIYCLVFIGILCISCIQGKEIFASELEKQSVSKDFLIEDGVLKKYKGTDTKIVIPSTVTTIGRFVFQGNKKIEELEIPSSVRVIDRFAFTRCTNLKRVEMSDGITTIGVDAFCECSSLSSIKLPNSVKNIDIGAFANCSNLVTIEIPNSVTTIGGGAFANCSNLTTVELPNSVTTLRGNTFSGCTSLTRMVIPNSVTGEFEGVFAGCKNLEQVTLSKNIKKIGVITFENCEKLKEIIIPNGVTEIGRDCFKGCFMLESIEIPKSVKKIDENFRDTPWGRKQKREQNMLILNQNLVDGKGCIDTVVIPKGVIRIGENAFDHSKTIKKVILPNTVTSIGAGAFVFSSLQEIEMGNSVKYIGSYAFEYCPMLKKVQLSPKILEICDFTLFARCNRLKQLTIPEGVRKVDLSAFLECKKLEHLVLPSKGIEIITFIPSNDVKASFVIHGGAGSNAEKMAKKSKILFKPIAINKTKGMIGKNETLQLEVGSDTQITKWSSSNPKIATVSKTGKVTGKKEGTVIITGKLYGKFYTCKVQVMSKGKQ